MIDVDPNAPTEPLSRALLGHYDLSGALFSYDEVPALAPALAPAGFSEWRVGAGRWEANTLLLPARSDGTPCPFPLPQAFAPAGSTDLDLIASRDWFSDDANPVSLADTDDDSRYALAYVRAAVDVATALGARPFVSLDSMPRALAVNRTPWRTQCSWTFTNRVSNVRPASPLVFAAAATGLVRRLVEGSGGEPGREVTHFEIWNEPELPFFWDPSFEDGSGPLDRFLEMAIHTLVRLDAYRASSGRAELRFGLASFASADTAVAVLTGFDQLTLPGIGAPPLDFISFHSYSNDPLAIAADVEAVADAAASTSHYADVELVLAEWGPDLAATGGDVGYASSMEPPLLVATVLALGAAAGLDRAHHTFFWDFYPGITWGLLDHDTNPRPLERTYALLAETIFEGGARMAPAGAPDGRLDGGLGAVLVARDPWGAVRALFVNRNPVARSAELRLGGTTIRPARLRVFDEPSAPIREVLVTQATFEVPARSLVLAELAPASPVPVLPGAEARAVLAALVGLAAFVALRRLRSAARRW